MKYFFLTPFLTLSFIFTGFTLSAQTEVPVHKTEHPTTPIIPLTPYDEMKEARPVEGGDDFQEKFLHMLFILALLIGFMITASMMLKRMTRARITNMNSQSTIKVLESRTLSPRSTLYLLDIEGKELLISESQAGVTFLTALPDSLKEESTSE